MRKCPRWPLLTAASVPAALQPRSVLGLGGLSEEEEGRKALLHLTPKQSPPTPVRESET